VVMIHSRDVAHKSGIEAIGLVKSFGSVRAVDGVDLVVSPGETVALLGPNGAGKSTLFDMMLGLLPPDAGSISVFGRPPTVAVDEGLVAGMLQTACLIRDVTVRELAVMVATSSPRLPNATAVVRPLNPPHGIASHPIVRRRLRTSVEPKVLPVSSNRTDIVALSVVVPGTRIVTRRP
jgi:ABC-type branched-subunit amino acid transport system ATPase component